jgi:tetratricopeptide (TPR) repeat protein
VSTLEEALRHVERLPAADRDRHVLDLVLHQAASLVPLGDFQAIVDLFGRHQASLERLDDPRVAGQYYFLLGRSQLFLGDDEAAAESARRGIEAATRSDDQATLGRLDYVLAQQDALSGRMPDGIEHARRAIRRLEQTGQQWWLGPAYWALGLNHALMGEFEPALEALERATALGQEVGDLELESVAGWPIGVIRTAQGEFDLGLEACRQALRVAPNPLNAATALGWLGHVHLESGDAEEAVTLLGQAVEQVGRFGFVQLEGWFTALLADAHRAAGRLGRAEELARHALALTRRTRSLYGVGLAERALGHVARAGGDLAAARTGFAAALETFGRIHARYEEGRTHLDLALAHGDDPARGTAARHLAAAYELFRLLRIPVHVARTRELAKELDVPLPDGPAR